jgi:hypothetical protein
MDNPERTIKPGECVVSLRDYFAAAALNGMMSNSTIEVKSDSPLPHDASLAAAAYAVADAMLKARGES